mgnify:FL=1
MEYRANFLWGFAVGSIEFIGYEFANGSTEVYQKEAWDDLNEAIKVKVLKDFFDFYKFKFGNGFQTDILETTIEHYITK